MLFFFLFSPPSPHQPLHKTPRLGIKSQHSDTLAEAQQRRNQKPAQQKAPIISPPNVPVVCAEPPQANYTYQFFFLATLSFQEKKK
jgi:hypothetical protein